MYVFYIWLSLSKLQQKTAPTPLCRKKFRGVTAELNSAVFINSAEFDSAMSMTPRSVTQRLWWHRGAFNKISSYCSFKGIVVQTWATYRTIGMSSTAPIISVNLRERNNYIKYCYVHNCKINRTHGDDIIFSLFCHCKLKDLIWNCKN